MGFSTILSADDLKKGDLVEPGWYIAEVSSYEEKEAGTDKSVNLLIGFKILADLSGKDKYKGVEPRKLFNEKALGFGKNLWAALKLKQNPDGGYNLDSALMQQVAAAKPKLKIYVVRGKSDKGNDFNDIKDWAPLDAPKA
jgi:hypothetical protein